MMRHVLAVVGSMTLLATFVASSADPQAPVTSGSTPFIASTNQPVRRGAPIHCIGEDFENYSNSRLCNLPPSVARPHEAYVREVSNQVYNLLREICRVDYKRFDQQSRLAIHSLVQRVNSAALVQAKITSQCNPQTHEAAIQQFETTLVQLHDYVSGKSAASLIATPTFRETSAEGGDANLRLSNLLSKFYSDTLSIFQITIDDASKLATLGHPDLIYGPFTRQDGEMIIAQLGEHNAITKAVVLGMSSGELLARLTVVKNDQFIPLNQRQAVEFYLSARFACERVVGRAIDKTAPPGSDEIFCGKLGESTSELVRNYVDDLDKNTSLTSAVEVAIKSHNSQR